MREKLFLKPFQIYQNGYQQCMVSFIRMSNKGRFQKSPTKTRNGTGAVGLKSDTILEGSAINLDIGTKQTVVNAVKNGGTSIRGDFYKEKYFTLVKTVEQIRNELKKKQIAIVELQENITLLKTQHVLDFENLKKQFTDCDREHKKEIDQLKVNLSTKDKEVHKLEFLLEKERISRKEELETLNFKHAEVLVSLQKTYEEEKRLLTENNLQEWQKTIQLHNDVLMAKDEQIQSLKQQIAHSFHENSKERQSQIDELVKELKQVSEEAEYVKGALKKIKIGSQDCSRCSFYENKCKLLVAQIQEKEEICRDLLKIGASMKKQLSQHDELNVLWNRIKEL